MKEVNYYVMKYGEKYYAPYKDMEAFTASSTVGVDSVLTENKSLAVRFGTKEMAEKIHEEEVLARMLAGDTSFEADKCRIVAVYKKEYNIH